VKFFGKKNVTEKVQTPTVSEEVLVVQQKESDPVDYIGWHNRGVSLSKSGMYEKANECYDKALEMDSQNAVTLNNKAMNLVEWAVSSLRQPNATEQFKKRLEESLEPFNKTLQINPNNASAWNDKGRALYLLSRYSEASECIDKGLAIDPKNIGLLNNKGIDLHRQKRLDEAIACFAEILSVDPGNVNAKEWVEGLKKRQNRG